LRPDEDAACADQSRAFALAGDDYNPPTVEDGSLELLKQARQRAERLITELDARLAEIEADPSKLPAGQLENARQLLAEAIASARRTLTAIDDATGTESLLSADENHK